MNVEQKTSTLSFTREQRLILQLLCEIHQALKIENGSDSELIERALTTGNTWAIHNEINLDEDNVIQEEIVDFVCDVMDMYRLLNASYSELSSEEQQILFDKGFVVKDKKNPIAFPGFDGNNEGRYRSVTFMFKRLEMYDSIEGYTKNSHCRMVPTYSNMLRVHETLLDSKRQEYHPLDAMLQILNNI